MRKKQNFSEMLELQFDKAAELFSEETLASMYLAQIVGGADNSVAQCGCTVSNSTAQCGCTNATAQCGCSSSSSSSSSSSGNGSGNSIKVNVSGVLCL